MKNISTSLQKIGYTPENGFVSCEEGNFSHISERLHSTERAKKIGASYVLFRRYVDNEGNITNAKPSVYVFNKEEFKGEKLTELHAKVWSAGEVDVYMLVDETNIEIYNARKPAHENENNKNGLDLSIEKLKLYEQAITEFNDQRFSAHIFGKGMFWEQEDFENKNNKDFYNNKLEEENTPFKQLLDYLLIARKTIKDQEICDEPETIDKLIIICLLIKFLEGIKDDNGKTTLEKIYEDKKITSLQEAFSKEQKNEIFFYILDNLAKVFKPIPELFPSEKPDIFNIFSLTERNQIAKSDLELLSLFLNAEMDLKTNQYFIWKQYDFNFLPIELISSIYENFLPKQKGTVYTPPFLVNFLVDEVMPLDNAQLLKNNKHYKILDPSCGSGVFLVSAYKRLLEWWIINNYYKTKEIIPPNKKICQELLKNNIFGVDIEPTATLITIFSLTISLLNKLTPKEVWNDLALDNLRENIIENDFFQWASNLEENQKDFDLIVGNPPFNDRSDVEIKNRNQKSSVKIDIELANKIGFKHKKIAGNKFALQFFEGAMALSKKTCLIIKSSDLLYNNTDSAKKYRSQVFTNFTVRKIFDFTHLRRKLFGKIDTYVCVIIAENKPSENNNIEHIVIKNIINTEKKKSFEIDHYDRHIVPFHWATDENKQFIWKTNLLGGGRLFNLINRFSMLDNLQKVVDKNQWGTPTGFYNYEIDNSKIELDNNKTELENNNVITRITKNNEIEFEQVPIKWKREFDKKQFTTPFLLFDMVLDKSSILCSLVEKKEEKPFYYNRDFFAIKFPNNFFKNVKEIFNRIITYNPEKLNYRLYLLATSSSAMISTETDVNKSEILNIPFPTNGEEKYLTLSKTEQIIQNDVLNYAIHFGKSINASGKSLYQKTTKIQLQNFGNAFCNTINPIHAEPKKNMFWQIGEIFQTKNKDFIAYQFIFGEKKEIPFEIQTKDWEELDKIFNNMIFNKNENSGGVFTRVIRLYDYVNNYDSLLLIKPNTLRYWLESIAVRDADTTIYDYHKAGF